MNFKSLMLGAAAAAAATGAQAADLPVAPEPVDYVRVCDAYGSGFYYLPGTETCLRISGRIRTEIRFNDFADGGTGNAWDSDADTSVAFRARGYANFDSRTATEFGLLRTYMSMYITNTTGSASNDSLTLDKAFIQFGGLTAGRAASFYDFYTGANWGSILNMGFADNGSVNLFAYTQAFGNGLSASISLEDGTDRRAGISGASYGGHKYPDLVANLRVDQGWGSAQIMGALHQVYVNSATIDSELGWAIGAGVSFDLPMISNSTSIGFQASYSDGAANFAATGNGTYFDAVSNGTNIKTTKAWAVGGGINHGWTSTLSSGLTASYISYDHGYAVADLKEINVQGNLVWSPVSGLDIGAEVEYTNDNYSAGTADEDALTAIFRVQRTF